MKTWYTNFVMDIIILGQCKWSDIFFDLGLLAGALLFVATFRFAGHTPLRNIVGLPVVLVVAAFMLFRVVARVQARILVVRS